VSQIGLWNQDCLKYDKKSKIIKPQFVWRDSTKSQGDAFVTSDVGQHQMWAAQFYSSTSHAAGSTPGLGHHGLRFCCGHGVQFANPGATVACVTGEASIQMCIQELSTCKQTAPIKIVNLNNKYMAWCASGSSSPRNRYSDRT